MIPLLHRLTDPSQQGPCLLADCVRAHRSFPLKAMSNGSVRRLHWAPPSNGAVGATGLITTASHLADRDTQRALEPLVHPRHEMRYYLHTVPLGQVLLPAGLPRHGSFLFQQTVGLTSLSHELFFETYSHVPRRPASYC